MSRLRFSLFMVFLGMGFPSIIWADSSPLPRTITDMAGRSLSIPRNIVRTYSVNPTGTVFLYTLAPDTLIGWNYPLSPDAARYVLPQYRSLPVLGSILGRSASANSEEIIRRRPQIVVFMGMIDSFMISNVDRIQSQLSIPVLMLDYRIEKLEAAYRLMGDILERKERAGELGRYCRKTLDDAEERLKKIPVGKRVRVYYAEGLDGLETDPAGSLQMQVLSRAGGANVFDEPVKSGFGRSRVSLEQILTWNPQVILVGYEKGHGAGLYPSLLQDARWQRLPAINRGRVYSVPSCPFSWFNHPPSVNRLIGIPWLTHLLYPGSGSDLSAEIKSFYAKFYRYSLTDQEIKNLLEGKNE